MLGGWISCDAFCCWHLGFECSEFDDLVFLPILKKDGY